jgi:hypothetical protein
VGAAVYLFSQHERNTTMGLYKVSLNVIHGAKDTRRNITMSVPAKDKLSAAIYAEHIADRKYLHESPTEYAHAVSVKPMPLRRGSVFTPAMPDAI